MPKTQAMTLGRCAVYARFSSDKQSDASIEDQVRRANALIEREGASSVEIFSDFGISGKDMKRPGVQALLAAIRKGAVDTVVTESVDRVSRDVEDGAHFRKLLAKHNVQLVCVDGVRLTPGDKSAPILFGVRSLFAEQFRIDLSDKTKRGKEGVALKGLCNGPLPYGYANDGKQNIVIVPERAEVVRRIYAEFDRGRALATIAHGLNQDGIPAPRGKGWQLSTVRVVLSCPKYGGTWDYQGHAMQRAHLRIVEPAVFARVASEMTLRKGRSSAPRTQQSHLVSGILKCAECGSNMISAGACKGVHYFACSLAKRKGLCANQKLVQVAKLEAMLLDHLRKTAQSCKAEIDELAAEELEKWKRAKAAKPSARKQLANTLAKTERELDNLVAALAATGSQRVARKIQELEAETADLRARLALTGDTAFTPPDVGELVRRVTSFVDLAQHGDTTEARFQLARWLADEAVYCAQTTKGVEVSYGFRFERHQSSSAQ